ncbi:unnamed protein product [marine sediment metagenome]|uniref:Uncharacterized protein n=1 Tax=marine sediment metagenome TaxID=412755 RepID=X1FT49_9ZZZZ
MSEQALEAHLDGQEQRPPEEMVMVEKGYLEWAGKKIAEQNADTARLDFLQAQTKGYGLGWILRVSLRGRGMRLHETSQEGAKPTVREAIDATMELSDNV